jgi:hypothetical protein
MTKKEALIAVLRLDVPDNTLDKALLDQEITGGDTYTTEDAEDIDMALLAILKSILHAPDISEGQYSIKYDRRIIAQRIASIEAQYEISVTRNAVRAPRVW